MRHWKLIAGTCIALAVAVGGLSVTASAGTAVNTAEAVRGQLDCELELNGKVESLDKRTYFAKIPGRIGRVEVREGDLVKKGDLLIAYDETELSRAKSLTELDAAAQLGRYDDSTQTGDRMAGLYGEAKRSIEELDRQIDNTEAVIIASRKILSDRQGELASRAAQLQADLACCTVGEDDDPEDVQEARERIEKEIAKNQYDQKYDPEIVRRQEELQYLEYLMTNYRAERSVMESQKASTQMNLATQGAKDRNEAIKAADDLENESRMRDYEAAFDGVRAESDGVITKLSVSEGSSVTAGQELIQVQSLSDTAIVCYVNKYDIVSIEEGQTGYAHIRNRDYTCHVSRIEKKTSDDGGTPGIRVECRIDDPDDQIILGIEAKTKIMTAMVVSALIIPTDALCSDDAGDYVFVVDDGKASRRDVVTGERNDDNTRILEGLKDGEIVVWDEASELTEGQSVKVR